MLDLKFSELGLRLEQTEISSAVKQLHSELEQKGLKFRPHCWLSDEWFVEDYIPGIAVPFYLAHPRLKTLEKKMMLEVEGGARRSCLQILRHECGHAIEIAYRLRSRKKLQALFGKTTKKYPNHYFPAPNSRDYVVHLEPYYAQCHPDEDFAETFAVWLTPGLDWRKRYAQWPKALAKLRYIDTLMHEIAGKRPLVSSKKRSQPIQRNQQTLRMHYEKRRAHFQLESPTFLDEDLAKLVGREGSTKNRPAAATVLREMGPEVSQEVARFTGEYRYVVHSVIRDMIRRSRELKLRVRRPRREVEEDLRVLLTKQTKQYIRSGRHRVAI